MCHSVLQDLGQSYQGSDEEMWYKKSSWLRNLIVAVIIVQLMMALEYMGLHNDRVQLFIVCNFMRRKQQKD